MLRVPHALYSSGILCLGAILIAAGPACAQSSAPAAPTDTPAPFFSASSPGPDLPAGWKNLPVAKGKLLTQYKLVSVSGATVIEADSVGSASALMHDGNMDLAQTPWLSWRWKVDHPVPKADNSVAALEDAPARLILIFDGDKSQLSFGDRTAARVAKSVGGQDLPYATLMYIWSTTAPVGNVIPNPHTDRIQMVVAAGGDASLGQWQSFNRNIADDFQSVFHEKPGKLLGYGVLTDSDNTNSTAHAWYGDIRFCHDKGGC